MMRWDNDVWTRTATPPRPSPVVPLVLYMLYGRVSLKLSISLERSSELFSSFARISRVNHFSVEGLLSCPVSVRTSMSGFLALSISITERHFVKVEIPPRILTCRTCRPGRRVAEPSIELSLRGPSGLSACSTSVLPRFDNQKLDNKHAALVSRAVSSAVGIAVTGVKRLAMTAVKSSDRRSRGENEVVALRAGPTK